MCKLTCGPQRNLHLQILPLVKKVCAPLIKTNTKLDRNETCIRIRHKRVLISIGFQICEEIDRIHQIWIQNLLQQQPQLKYLAAVVVVVVLSI